MHTHHLTILADENIPGLHALFGDYARLVVKPGRALVAADLVDVDVLLIRSITQVDRALLAQANRLQAVATATIGTDHVDQALLAERGVAFYNAPGCNAVAVCEYVLTVLFHLVGDLARLQMLTVGIVGVGNVGGRLQQRLQRLGVRVLLNDPPRQARGESGFCELTSLLAEADIVCLHTPLTRHGPHASYHLFGEAQLRQLKPGALLINAGRGAVVDNQALLARLQEDPAVQAVLDVWEDEPRVDPALMARVQLATPHIAGYSLEGKWRGTHMLRAALATQFGWPVPAPLVDYLPTPEVCQVTLSASASVNSVLAWVYDPRRDDRALRLSLADADPGQQFDRLRKTYPVRREFAALQVIAATPEQADLLSRLGFHCQIGGAC